MSSVSSSSNQPTHCYFQLHEMGRVLGEIISSEEIPRSENGPTHHTKIVERMYVQIGGPIGSGMYSTILKVASSFDSKEYAFKFPKSLQRNTRHLNESKILRFLSAQSAEVVEFNPIVELRTFKIVE